MPSGSASRASPSHRSQSSAGAKHGSAYVSPGSSDPMDGVIVDWWAPPSGARVMPAGVPTTTKRDPGVEAVDQGVEAAADERVVDRADGEQVLAVELVAEPERVQQEEEVHLADAELDVLAGRGLLPAQQAVLAEEVDLFGGGEHAHLVDPAAEVRRHADVRRGGDDPLADAGHVGEPGEDAAERLLRRRRRRRRDADGDRDRQRRPGRHGDVVELATGRAADQTLR